LDRKFPDMLVLCSLFR